MATAGLSALQLDTGSNSLSDYWQWPARGRLSQCEASAGDLHQVSEPDAQLSQAAGSWRLNLGRTSGFWGDARWYDVQIDRKLGVGAQMIDELVFALPPLPAGSRVADLCSGSGRAALSLLRAYPEAHVTLVDMDDRRTAIAMALAHQMGLQDQVQVVQAALDPDAPSSSATVPGGPAGGYDLVTATCAIRVMANPPAHYALSSTSRATETNCKQLPVRNHHKARKHAFFDGRRLARPRSMSMRGGVTTIP